MLAYVCSSKCVPMCAAGWWNCVCVCLLKMKEEIILRVLTKNPVLHLGALSGADDRSLGHL